MKKDKKLYAFIKALRKVPHSNMTKDLAKYYALFKKTEPPQKSS